MNLFDYIFGSNIFDINIPNYLTPINLYSISTTCKYFKTYITMDIYKKCLIKEINIRLKHIFHDKLFDFKKILIESQAVISGSFIIQCALGEYWTGSDIDIYVAMEENQTNWLDGRTDYSKTIVDDFMYTQLKLKGNAESYPVEISNKIDYVRGYYDKHKKIQIIGVKIKKGISYMTDFINETFDFNICKNIYWVDTTDNIQIHSINEILSKKTNFTIGKHLSSSLSRYPKYVDYGFEFENKKLLTYNGLLQINNNTKYSIFKINGTKTNCDLIDYFFEDLIKINHIRELYKSDNSKHMFVDPYKCTSDCIIKFCNDKTKHSHYTKQNNKIIVIS